MAASLAAAAASFRTVFNPTPPNSDKLKAPKVGELPVRRLSISVMDWLASEGHVHKEWRNFRHAKLDFSAVEFNLESFQPFDFDWAGRQGEESNSKDKRRADTKHNREGVHVYRVSEANMDNNSLTDDMFDFRNAEKKSLSAILFCRLRILSLQHNLLSYPVVLLPTLKELYLGHNQITRMPLLAGVPHLEVLSLPDNLIVLDDTELFESGSIPKSLKWVDLSSNKLNFVPSTLARSMEALQVLNSLGTLHIRGNPFCTYFPEYQALVLRSLPNLIELDNLNLSKDTSLKKELLAQADFCFGYTFRRNEPESVDDHSDVSFSEMKDLLRKELGVDIKRPEDARKYLFKDRLDAFDRIVQERKVARKRHQNLDIDDGYNNRNFLKGLDDSENLPYISELIREFDEAIVGHTDIMIAVNLVFERASNISCEFPDNFKRMFDNVEISQYRRERVDKDEDNFREEASATLMQQIGILFERYPDSRSLLIRTLAKLAPVPCYRLGELSFLEIFACARNSEESRIMVLDAIFEIILPIVNDKNLSHPSFPIVLAGLSKCDVYGLSEKLLLVAPKLMSLVKSSVYERELNAYVHVLLRCAVEYPRCAKMVAEDENFGYVVREVIDREHFRHPRLFVVFENAVGTLRSCLRHCHQDVLKALIKLEEKGNDGKSFIFHKSLLENLFLTVRAHQASNSKIFDLELQPQLLRKLGAVIELITDLTVEERVMRDLLDTDKPQDNLYINLIVGNPVTGGICRNSQADPLLLTAAFRFLTVLLLPLGQHLGHSPSKCKCLDCARVDVPWVRDKYLPLIIENLRLDEQDQNVAFRCIDLRHFSPILQKCEDHSMLSEAYNDEILESPAKILPMRDSLSTNLFAHRLIISVVNFVSIWGKLDDVYGKESKLHKLVRRTSKRINEDGRERLLFALLELPSVDVQDAVVRCLGNANIEELDDFEVQSFLDLLDPAHVARKERLFTSILERLGEFLNASGAGADKFRSRFASVVIETTFKVLAKNASRPTYNNVVEENDKLGLSLRAAEVLRIASDSSQHLLWRHMRTFEVADCFRQILKGEELSSSLQSPDVLVEVTWTGRNVELLCSCLSGRYHTKLDSRKKQGFRVLSRIADVICGVMDTPENASRSAEVRANAEAAMWKDRLIRRDVSMFDKILIDTSRQQETYNAFRCFELTLNFVEAGQLLEDDAIFRKTSIGKSNFLAQLVGLKGDVDEALKTLNEHAAGKEKKLVEAEKLRKNREAAVEIVLTEALKPKGLKVGEKFFNAFFAQSRRAPDLTQLTHFGPIVAPRKLDLFGDFYLEEGQPEVRVAYSLAAMLRTVYGMLIVPCHERYRHGMIQTLRVPAILLRLIALVETRRSLCTCNVGAKLLRVFSEALTLQAGQDVPQGDGYIECLLISAKWAGTCLEYAKPLLQRIGSNVLTEAQMNLCTEAVRMLRSAAFGLGRMKVGVTHKVQEEIVQEALRFAFPSTTLVTIVLCLVYDLEMSGPCSRTFDLLVKSSLARLGIRDLGSEVLAQLLHSCPPVRYEVLESFNHLEVMRGYSIRESYIAELMDRVQMFLYMRAIDLILQNPEHPKFIKGTERVLVAVDIELPLKRGGVVDWFGGLTSSTDLPPAQMLLLTTARILVLDRPVHAFQATKCGHCPAESFCPAGPTIQQQFEYKELTRIISGPDRQALMIGYVQYTRGALHSNVTPFDRVSGETFDMIICHKSYKRKAVADTLRALSGPNIDSRVKIDYDEGLYHGLAPYIDNAFCFDFVFIEGSKFRLIVLEKERFSTLEIRFDLWRPPVGDLLHVDEAQNPAVANRGFAPGGLVRQDSPLQTNHDQSRDKDEVMEALGISSQTRRDDTSGEEFLVDTIRERAKILTAGKYAGQRCDPSMVRLDERRSMSDLEQVDFAHGDVPLLSLTFKTNGTTTEFPIRFLDDMSRDEWRRSLASILHESASFERHHDTIVHA